HGGALHGHELRANGLTAAEIEAMEQRLERLLRPVDKGELHTFCPVRCGVCLGSSPADSPSSVGDAFLSEFYSLRSEAPARIRAATLSAIGGGGGGKNKLADDRASAWSADPGG